MIYEAQMIIPKENIPIDIHIGNIVKIPLPDGTDLVLKVTNVCPSEDNKGWVISLIK